MSQHIANNVLDMIGNTPIVELTKLDTGLCRLFLKLENQNPVGSIKDRIGVSLIMPNAVHATRFQLFL